jgi:hypothetical protein
VYLFDILISFVYFDDGGGIFYHVDAREQLADL